jgi:hypothetical protein
LGQGVIGGPKFGKIINYYQVIRSGVEEKASPLVREEGKFTPPKARKRR